MQDSVFMIGVLVLCALVIIGYAIERCIRAVGQVATDAIDAALADDYDDAYDDDDEDDKSTKPTLSIVAIPLGKFPGPETRSGDSSREFIATIGGHTYGITAHNLTKSQAERILKIAKGEKLTIQDLVDKGRDHFVWLGDLTAEQAEAIAAIVKETGEMSSEPVKQTSEPNPGAPPTP